MVLVCLLFIFQNLANSLNPEFTLTLQGCYIITMYTNITLLSVNRQMSVYFIKKVHLDGLKLIILIVNRKQLILPCSYLNPRLVFFTQCTGPLNNSHL